MTIPLGRQEELKWLLEDSVVGVLYRYIIWRKITETELEWMVNLLSTILTLPTLLAMQPTMQQETGEMASAVIVQRYVDKDLDEKYLDIAMGERNQYMGYAFVSEGNVIYDCINSSNKAEIKEEISTTKTEGKMIFCFQKDTDTDESKQPFVSLTKENGTPICVSFIEGDLQGFGAPETSHSMPFAAHQEYLLPKLIDIFTSCGEDIGKTVEKLDSNFTKREIINNLFPGQKEDTRGEILILFSNGQSINMIKGDKHKKYEWGETSLAFGYEGKPIETPVRKGLGGKGSVPPVKKPDTAIADALKKAEDKKGGLDHMIVPPGHIFQSVRALEAWYRGYGDPASMPTNEELVAMKGQAHLGIPIKIRPQISNEGFNKLLEGRKVLLASTAGKPSEKTEKKDTKPVIPMIIIPDKERELLDKDFWPEIAKGNPKLVADPVAINEFLNGKPTASEQLGRQAGIREFEVLTADGFGLLMKTAPEAAKAVFVQMQNEIYRSNVALRKATERKAM